MFVQRSTKAAETSEAITALRKACLGCKQCRGTCFELLQMKLVPDMLGKRKASRA